MGFVGPVQRVVGVVIIASWMAARAGAQGARRRRHPLGAS